MTTFGDHPGVPGPHEALPAYLTDVEASPAPSLSDLWVRVRDGAKLMLEQDAERQRQRSATRAGGGTVQPSPSVDRRGSNFLGMIPVPACLLDDAIDRWWIEDSRGDVLIVAHRLRLRHPEGSSPDVVAMDGKLRRLLPGPWIPVRLELWPHYDRWALYTMRPLRRLVPSRWYFRRGHRALDQVSRRLVGIARQMESV